MFEIERAFTYLGNDEYEKRHYRVRGIIYAQEHDMTELAKRLPYDPYERPEMYGDWNLDGEENKYFLEYRFEEDEEWLVEEDRVGYHNMMELLRELETTTEEWGL